jgi:tetratricopeptide (TPR) repeat protein
LLIAESALRFTRWQPPFPPDPFVGFDKVEPLFTTPANNDAQKITNPAKLGFFAHQSFSTQKPADEFRVFCLGGSTVQGRPYSAETSLTAWLELSLASAESNTQPRVINCGGISYASYRLVPILAEVLEYEPDLIIICTGQNEFLEARTYGDLKEVSAARVRTRRALGRLRTFQWVEQQLRSPTSPKQLLSTEVDALLDDNGGLADYHRDDDWSAAIQQHYAFNLEALVQRCEEASVPVLFLLPVSNLVDCPPFKFELSQNLSAPRRAVFQLHWNNALDDSLSLAERLREIQAAVQIDPRHAGAQFRLGKVYEGLGRHREAAECFHRARDEDICPLRMLGSMYDVAEETLERRRIPYLDLRQIIQDAGHGQLPSNAWMVDHVHPTVRGHQVIGIKIHEKLAELGWVVAPNDDLDEKRSVAFRDHLISLDETYFARGKAKLEGLKLWTQGRANK